MVTEELTRTRSLTVNYNYTVNKKCLCIYLTIIKMLFFHNEKLISKQKQDYDRNNNIK